MKPCLLQSEFLRILESSFLASNAGSEGREEVLCLSESEMFQLWNVLGEELGIDLSLASPEQRRLLFDACDNGKRLAPRDFGSLLWLVYYGDAPYQ